MPDFIISGISVNFPFEPYDVQKAYMEKVIESLENGTNAVLESPTGTGKTLCLLCATLAWVATKRKEIDQQIRIKAENSVGKNEGLLMREQLKSFENDSDQVNLTALSNWGAPKVIYASRTHSQLSQAMQELKRSNYSYMKSIVLGSRDQLCIHPEVSKEQNNSTKIQLCKMHVSNRSCSFHSRIESKKDSPEFKGQAILDIEDLITFGRKLKMCPYYGSREVMQDAQIIFMPYNYLLDPKARKANKVELNNTIVILDEGHNVEKVCEESASVQVKSSDLALAIEDVTHIMKAMQKDDDLDLMAGNDDPKDFTLDDLALLKEIVLKLEERIDQIEVKIKAGGRTFPGGYIFELLNDANIHFGNYQLILDLLDKILTYLATMAQRNPIMRKGLGLQVFQDLLIIAFSGQNEERIDKIRRSFKVHVDVEEVHAKQNQMSKNKDGWISTKITSSTISSKKPKVINYWCFNSGFGMEILLQKKVRNIILTSGTLAPLKPLIAELGIPIKTQLENPHIVGKSQVCVKVISHGPDKEQLISNYQNHDNVKYHTSLGSTINNFCSVVPDGILIFFPSYHLMNKSIDIWRASGIYSQINKKKKIFVEPQGRDAFSTTMVEFYESIRKNEGACFVAVCRGKVSEGLDFADTNGRAVVITGLPFPPYKNPRVILKKQYLQENRTIQNQLMSGQEWYSLEASRAVNQAIGRVIRHKNDYGAILLCDIRFAQRQQQQQLSTWIQGHLNSNQQISQTTNFGIVQRELRCFFENAKKTLPPPSVREGAIIDLCGKQNPSSNNFSNEFQQMPKGISFKSETIREDKFDTFDVSQYKGIKTEKKLDLSFLSRLESNVSSINFNETISNTVKVDKRERSPLSKSPLFNTEAKKKRYKLISNESAARLASQEPQAGCSSQMESNPEMKRKDFLELIKNSLNKENYNKFIQCLMKYQKENDIRLFFDSLVSLFRHPTSHYLLKNMRKYVKEPHKASFDKLLQSFLESF